MILVTDELYIVNLTEIAFHNIKYLSNTSKFCFRIIKNW